MSDVDLQTKINNFLKSALENFSVKNYNDAIRDLKAAEVLDKNNPEILYNLGINYCRLGLYKTSINYFKKVLKLPYTFVEIFKLKKLLAFVLINTNSYKEAIKHLDEVIDLSPSDITALNMKGYALEKTEKYSDAIKIYKSIINIDKNNYNAYNSLAYIITITNGNLNEALRYAKVAFDSDKKNSAYLDTIGYIFMKKKEIKAAQKYFTMALQLSPFSKEIENHLKEINLKN